MDKTQILNSKYQTIAWGLLSILWGITILLAFIPFGVGVLGTGLVVLGLNVVRTINNLPTKKSQNALGFFMFAWGGLELMRPLVRLTFKSADLDWVIFAILLIGLGLILSLQGILQPSSEPERSHSHGS